MVGKRSVVALVILLAGAGCSRLAYYSHVVRGGLEITARKKPVEAVRRDPETSAELRERLELADRIRKFAIADLALPDNGSYRGYVQLDREYASWTVVAAAELSIEPVLWCFPVAGCVSYRGYFSPEKAEKFAEKLRRSGLEVDLGGVTAFSTLGWLKDPLLSSFIGLPEPALAGLIFHELAHQRVYVKDDTAFNESFATVVEEEGVRRWLESRGREDLREEYLLAAARRREIVELALDHRKVLAEIYAAQGDDDGKRRSKAEVLDDLRKAFEALRAEWGSGYGYDSWFGEGLNNARLASIGAYHEHVPAFRGLLAEQGGRLAAFYSEAEFLAALPAKARAVSLAAGAS